jgi:hypothetical protein
MSKLEDGLRDAIFGISAIRYGLRGSYITRGTIDMLIEMTETTLRDCYKALGEELPVCSACGSLDDNDDCDTCMERK